MTRSALQPWISSAIAPRILLAVGLFVDPAIEDPDTGLTYVVPEKKAVKPFASLPPGPEAGPRVLDDVILLSRLAKHSGAEPSVILTRISAVVTKPRRGYAVGGANGAAFDRDGRFFGVATLRTEPTAGIGSLMPLVIPAAGEDHVRAASHHRLRTSSYARTVASSDAIRTRSSLV
jgi:hypothetical protein